MGKLIGLIILVLDVLAVLDCLKSNKTTGKKALWIAIIVLLPAVGLVAYHLVGKKQ
ncbi:MAG: PLD nuclease N-terminal domain-containing protein [Candidatus Zapsychrus exili]|nr:PLD nuclease N-terminal domain-containing protein [Candidatus Zapsychrus exili]